MRLQFDRGTVLVRELQRGVDVSDLPGVLWDPRVEAYRAPACRYHSLRGALIRRAVPFTDDVPAKWSGVARAAWAAVELRPYQEAALYAWELAGRRALVVLPTGGGKTRVAIAAMARTRLTTLCVVPTRVLLDQWRREIARLHAGPIGCYGDGAHDLAPITVATFESAYRHMGQLGHRFDLLVVDEAHHFGCGVRDEALEMTIAQARLGLTATPPREGAAAERLTELIGRTAYELTVGDLAGRFLAGFDAVVLHLDLNESERRAYEHWTAIFRTDAPVPVDGRRDRARGERPRHRAARTAARAHLHGRSR